MNIHSKYIENAVEQLSTLPGIGKKSALRLVLNLLNREKSEVEAFSNAFIEMMENVKSCKVCHNISDTEICSICSNPSRDSQIICVVEDIRDILAIENTESFKGVYHVLGGVISPIDGIGPSDLNIESLISRIENDTVSEVILALNSGMEGDTTNFYLFRKLALKIGLKITSLSRGVAIGTELQYADELTLGKSIENRTEFKGFIEPRY
ncbi:MAG: recombination mediator RecR [Crocinitomicaceae bacterium]